MWCSGKVTIWSRQGASFCPFIRLPILLKMFEMTRRWKNDFHPFKKLSYLASLYRWQLPFWGVAWLHHSIQSRSPPSSHPPSNQLTMCRLPRICLMVVVCIVGLITTAVLVPPHWCFLGFNRWTLMQCTAPGNTRHLKRTAILLSTTTQPVFVPTDDISDCTFSHEDCFLTWSTSRLSQPGSWPLLLNPKPIRDISLLVRQHDLGKLC